MDPLTPDERIAKTIEEAKSGNDAVFERMTGLDPTSDEFGLHLEYHRYTAGIISWLESTPKTEVD